MSNCLGDNQILPQYADDSLASSYPGRVVLHDTVGASLTPPATVDADSIADP
jgi:hypothetical protein